MTPKVTISHFADRRTPSVIRFECQACSRSTFSNVSESEPLAPTAALAKLLAHECSTPSANAVGDSTDNRIAEAENAAMREKNEHLAKMISEREHYRTRAEGAERDLAEVAERVATIASETFGPLPVQTVEENLTSLEQGVFRQRQRVWALETPDVVDLQARLIDLIWAKIRDEEKKGNLASILADRELATRSLSELRDELARTKAAYESVRDDRIAMRDEMKQRIELETGRADKAEASDALGREARNIIGAALDELVGSHSSSLVDCANAIVKIAVDSRIEVVAAKKDSEDISRYCIENFVEYKYRRNEQHDAYDKLAAERDALVKRLGVEVARTTELGLELVRAARQAERVPPLISDIMRRRIDQAMAGPELPQSMLDELYPDAEVRAHFYEVLGDVSRLTSALDALWPERPRAGVASIDAAISYLSLLKAARDTACQEWETWMGSSPTAGSGEMRELESCRKAPLA